MAARDELGSRAGHHRRQPDRRRSSSGIRPSTTACSREAFAAAEAAGVRGKAVTPFLLSFIVDASGGRSLEVNLDLARNNVRVAADIATAWSALGRAA